MNEPSSMSAKALKIFERADRGRAGKGLKTLRVGFRYADAIEAIEDCGYKPKEIAECIGCSRVQVIHIRDEGDIPKHITGELLWGLCVDLFGYEADGITPKARAMFCDDAQRDGGTVGPKKPRTHRIK